MKFESSDFLESQIFINNPSKNINISYNQIFANAFEISKDNKIYKRNSLMLVLAKDENLLLSSIIACWINGQIPAVYSPNLSENEYSTLQKKYLISGIITQDNVNINKENENISIQNFNDNINLKDFYFEFNNDQIALVLFSSGTTGQPKAIPLTFSNIRSNIKAFNERLNINSSNIFLCASPIWHAHGLYNSFLTAFFLKSEVIYSGQLSIMNVYILFKSILDKNNIVFHITPSMVPILLAISKKIPKSQLPKFHKIICGTSFIDINSKKDLESTFNIELIQQYGMTETLFISVNEKFALQKSTSVGKPLDNVNLEIWNDKVLKNNEEGAIRLKSTSWFGNYLDEKINSTEDYFYTGDLGFIDDDGCLFITGRIKDLIKKGGFSISAVEITNNLLNIPNIEDAYTLSNIDSKLGEEIYSFYVSDIDIPKQLILSELGKNIPNNLLPKEFYRVSEILKTDTGKVSKLKMKEILEMKLNE